MPTEVLALAIKYRGALDLVRGDQAIDLVGRGAARARGGGPKRILLLHRVLPGGT